MFWAEIGAKRPNYGQHRAVRWHRTVRSDTVFSNRPYLHRIVRRITVRYLITVKKAEVRRISTSLFIPRRVCLLCICLMRAGSEVSHRLGECVQYMLCINTPCV